MITTQKPTITLTSVQHKELHAAKQIVEKFQNNPAGYRNWRNYVAWIYRTMETLREAAGIPEPTLQEQIEIAKVPSRELKEMANLVNILENDFNLVEDEKAISECGYCRYGYQIEF